MQEEGKAYVIRPKQASDVGRIEKDKEKMLALYEEGYADAKARYEEILAYLNS